MAEVYAKVIASTRLCGPLQAIATLDNQSIPPDAVSSLIQIAVDMAKELNRNLDSVAMTKG
ncbi:hypothetical protein QCN27_08835 [Cereibacter sp. SYSU M97828]|nr:hypothetical protein [Cereibacter flavus]